jgi:hypothetical protein
MASVPPPPHIELSKEEKERECCKVSKYASMSE